jgi:hypothetical protein
MEERLFEVVASEEKSKLGERRVGDLFERIAHAALYSIKRAWMLTMMWYGARFFWFFIFFGY